MEAAERELTMQRWRWREEERERREREAEVEERRRWMTPQQRQYDEMRVRVANGFRGRRTYVE